jgi:hypothetical protein
LLATVVVLEIDRLERFESAAKLSANAGLVPTTYACGLAHLPRQAHAAE